MRYKTHTLLALLSMLACANANASQAQVRQALEAQDYATAGTLVKAAPPGQNRAVLLALARQNMVPAQWLLAGDYWREGDVENAVNWVFTARMGTLLDSSTCVDKRAEQVDRYVSHVYRDVFLRSASDPALEQRALRDASAFHQKSIERTIDPEWTCRYWAAIDPQQRRLRDMEISPDKKMDERRRTLQKILRRGRIDLGIPVEGKKELDPLKKSLLPSGVPQSWLGSGSK